jgi:hypothetical protein
LNIEADFGGGFEYGGGFWRRIWIWRRISEADLNMEADFFSRGRIFFARKSKTCYSVSSFFNKGSSK